MRTIRRQTVGKRRPVSPFMRLLASNSKIVGGRLNGVKNIPPSATSSGKAPSLPVREAKPFHNDFGLDLFQYKGAVYEGQDGPAILSLGRQRI